MLVGPSNMRRTQAYKYQEDSSILPLLQFSRHKTILRPKYKADFGKYPKTKIFDLWPPTKKHADYINGIEKSLLWTKK